MLCQVFVFAISSVFLFGAKIKNGGIKISNIQEKRKKITQESLNIYKWISLILCVKKNIFIVKINLY